MPKLAGAAACRLTDGSVDPAARTCHRRAVGIGRGARFAPADGPTPLERAPHLSVLRDAWAEARAARGVLVLLGGEAGAGKTTLVRHVCRTEPAARVLWGSCDPLFTPRPLGPFADIADGLGGELRDLVDIGAKPHQIAAVVGRAAQDRPGTVVVLEDLHWADEATLDVLSLLGRRIRLIPALLVATYRDDELHRTHPLRTLLGELRDAGTAGSVRRLTAGRLSLDAVRSLAEPYGIDPEALHRTTAGNPFFVTEVLACGGADLPGTVRDAVLARVARLPGPATAVAEAVAVLLPHAELWLLGALLPEAVTAVQQCLDSGVLGPVPGGVAYRHELARLAVEESLPSHRRVDLHRRALRALAAAPRTAAGLARLAYHAEAAGDAEAVLRFAPAAAEYAAASGAHREAAAQYARALRFTDAADLLEARSQECYLTGEMAESIAAMRRAIDGHRARGDGRREGSALVQLSRRLWCAGRGTEATAAGHAAVHVLRELPPGPELAQAYSLIAAVHLNDERAEPTEAWGRRALELADTVGDQATVVHSLNNLGTMRLLSGRPDGVERLARSLALAERLGMADQVGRAFIHAGWALTRTRAYGLAPWLERGVHRCAELGLESWRCYLVAYRARVRLDQGRWTDAADDAAFVLRSAHSVPLLRILGLTVHGLVLARRGDRHSWAPLDEALTLLDGQNALQFQLPVASARAEAAWLSGRSESIDDTTRHALTAAVERQSAWAVGELAWWRRLAGIDEKVAGAVDPYAAQLAGATEAAAEQWARRGCRYDAALAVAASDDESRLRHALAEFQRLGARPAAAIVARRLRERGARRLPRGPRPQTRADPAHLTGREAEVLELIRHGATNAEIAARLHISPKTVHHHVSAVLRKLGVSSRGQAAFEATRQAAAGPPPPR